MGKNYTDLKKTATRLRCAGLSYNEIRQSVDVSKSTLSLWLKSIPLKPEYKKRLYTKQIEILSMGPQSQKERRIREISKILKDAEGEIELPPSLDAYKLFGAALYWGEGTKGQGFEITNSDPHCILFMVRWFEKIFQISPEVLRAHLNIYPQQNESEIRRFWSHLTGIPLRNFGKTFIKPVSKNYKKNILYFGTIKVRVPKGTDMRHRTFGWVRAILRDIDPKVQLAQSKWASLTKTPRPVNLSTNKDLRPSA